MGSIDGDRSTMTGGEEQKGKSRIEAAWWGRVRGADACAWRRQWRAILQAGRAQRAVSQWGGEGGWGVIGSSRFGAPSMAALLGQHGHVGAAAV